jgi:phage terminase large subunit
VIVEKDEQSESGLPHDARAKTFRSKRTVVEEFLAAVGHGKVDVVPQSKKMDQINAARSVMKRCEFHRSNCAEGLDGLRAWEFDYDEDEQVFSRNPVNNWASHPSDAFAYGAQVMETYETPKPAEETQPKFFGDSRHYGPVVTFEDLWEEEAREQEKRRRVLGWV